ncbi:hypothetical protein [Lutibacter sp.]|uniref:hypothetical protein n=1 Tax=Lutibacter sp. TaxID=1925666 RepID=UPI0025BE3211|nr:hypothetical protein [Lutibacter sp.]MCF6168045.1 hypothetical protein [Lutibacter sp.]
MISFKTIESILKISGQILMVVGFFVFFIGLLASPVIYINIKQRHFFKKFTKKYHLKIEPYKHFVIRDFPYASGKINDKNVFIEATKLGKSYYNIHFDTFKYSSPVIKLGVEFNNPAIKKIVLTQKKLFSSQYISEFDKYFNVEVKPEEFESKIFNNRTKQNIMNYSRKSQKYVNLFLDKGYLLSISNFELTNAKKYNTIVDKFTLMMSIINTK